MPTINEELIAACRISGTGFNLQKVMDLLYQGADINTRDYNGDTPLHLAVANQNPMSKELIVLLISSGANYKIKNTSGKLAHESVYTITSVTRRNILLFCSLVDQAEWNKEQQALEIQKSILSNMQEQTKLLAEMKNQIEQLKGELQQVKNQVENKESSKQNSTQGFFS
jgi:ankyrin repeat protein